MHIAQVSKYSPLDFRGGMEQYVREISEHLAISKNNTVHVIGKAKGRAFTGVTLHNGVFWHRTGLPWIPNVVRSNDFVCSATGMFRAALIDRSGRKNNTPAMQASEGWPKNIDISKLDIVHCHSSTAFAAGLNNPFFRYRLRLLRNTKRGKGATPSGAVPLVITIHGVDREYYGHKLARMSSFTPKRPFIRTEWEVTQRLTAKMYRSASLLLCQGKRDRSIVVNDFGISPSKIKILPSGIRAVGAPQPVDPEVGLRRLHSLLPAVPDADGGQRLVLFVGDMKWRKGPDLLLRAFAKNEKDLKDVHLLFIGKGPLLEKLPGEAVEKGLADRVTFAGRVSNEVLEAAYPAATLFALPSFAEGSPISIMEAMRAGVPILTTDVGNNRETVGEMFGNGTVVPAGDVDALGKALKEMLNGGIASEATIRETRKRCRKVVETNFDWNVITDRLSGFYRELVE